MDVEKIFHMTGGSGKTSYSRNSSLQKKGSDKVKHIALETLEQVYLTLEPKSLGMADFGCSSGPNTLSNLQDMVDTIVLQQRRHPAAPPPELRVYLNDLPTNDFNAVFQALPEFYRNLKKGRGDGGGDAGGGEPSVYVAGYPGSFYGRLFPDYCLHFIYASHSLHWLSTVPKGLYDENNRSINKGSVYITERSPLQVAEAYREQFRLDFSLFLRSRSEELVEEGRMVLILLGREGNDHVDRGNSFFWELLTRSLLTLVPKGDIEEEKIDSYDVHFYAPSREELEEVVNKQGSSFKLEQLEMFDAEKEINNNNNNNNDEDEECISTISYGAMVAMAVRAIQESMLAHHFGESILDELFEIYARLLDEEMAKQVIKPIMFVVVLRKLL